MKRKLLFFVTLLCLFMVSSKAYALENFYEGEYIDGIYTKSVYVKNSSSKYQKARFFRRSSDNKAAYCVEPLTDFNSSSSYESSINPINISSDTWKKMSLIAYYGYGYKNHTDSKWYAITQLLIWREADINTSFYFTNGLNGPKINQFEDEINEIYSLINTHQKIPSFANQTINVKKGTNYIYDTNYSIENFISNDANISVIDNKIDISNLEEGNYTFNFERNIDNLEEPVLFYYSPTSQNIMTSGNIEKDLFSVNVNVYDTEININKIDADTKTSKASGSAKLCDAIFELYDNNDNLIKEITLDKNCNAIVKGIDLGEYYIKEKTPGEGYLKSEDVIKVVLDLNNTKQTYQISNKVINKEIELYKEYGTSDELYPEKDVIFDIYSDDKYIDTIVTNNNGNAFITLPYGKYKFTQVSGKDGYSNVDDFEVVVDNSEKVKVNLVDYKIKVPDTRSEANTFPLSIVLGIYLLLNYYVKKKSFI